MAVLLQFAIFAVFACVGFGVLAALGARRIALRDVLLAPTFGAALLTIAAVLLNHLGLPVRAFALPLVVAALAGAIAALAWRRPSVPWRTVGPFAALLVLGLALSARPSFEFGFDWLSYVNEDMTNYASTAQRLVDYPFYALPPQAAIDAGRQLSAEGYWFHDILGNERVGVETLLAMVVVLAKTDAFRAFMPLCIAGYFLLIWATAGLAIARTYRPWLAFGAGLALALSSLTTLGLLYQLLGQIFGLAALAAAVALSGDDPAPASRRALVARWAVRAIAYAFVVAVYPELFPFVALLVALLFVLRALRRPAALRDGSAFVEPAALVAAFAILGNYGLAMARLIALRLHSATAPHGEVIFPYFLLPSGLGNLWGLVPLASYPADPWMSIAIATGAALLVFAAVASLFALRRGHPAAIIALTMVALGGFFFVRRDDFALFKLAMYAQPFLLVGIAAGVAEMLGGLRLRLRQTFAAATVVVVGALGLYAQQQYVQLSRGTPDLPDYEFVEIPQVSNKHLLGVLEAAEQRARGGLVVTDTLSPIYGKIESALFAGEPFAFLSDDYLERFRISAPVFAAPDPKRIERDARLQRAEFKTREPLKPFALPGVRRLGDNALTSTWIPPQPSPERWMLALGSDGSILNRSTDAAPDALVTLRPWSSVRNHLTFVQTTHAGRAGWVVTTSEATLFRSERDFFYPESTMEGLGRDLVFEVTNPTPPLRLVLWTTASLKDDGRKLVPRASVFGATTVPIPSTGRGSSRLVSAPFSPRSIDGREYFGIDFGEDGQFFRKTFGGLMRLYGKDLRIDPRRLVVFGRDISVVSDADYQRWQVPDWIVDVPALLKDPHLVYSGIYEDNGWCSDNVVMTLRSDAQALRFRVDGLVPQVGPQSGFTTRLNVTIDGTPLADSLLHVGPFTLERAIALRPGKHEVRLTFTATQRFPPPDNRLVAARLDSIGFPP